MVLEIEAAHAIATFSELGIATSILLIVDVTHWRETVKAALGGGPVSVTDLLNEAERKGFLYACALKIARWGDNFQHSAKSKLLLWLPFFSLTLGVSALIAIATISGAVEYAFWVSLSSFLLSLIAAFIEKLNIRIKKAADEARDTVVPPLPT